MDWSEYDEILDGIARHTCASGWVITDWLGGFTYRGVGIYTGSTCEMEIDGVHPQKVIGWAVVHPAHQP